MPDPKHSTLLQNPMVFKESWLCEALRLKETQWGQLDDRAASLRAAREPTAARQIALRANLLGEMTGVLLALGRVQSGLWVALIVLLVIAVMVGGSAAFAALGAELQSVNVVSALVVLLGVNLVSLTFWLLSLFIGGWLWRLACTDLAMVGSQTCNRARGCIGRASLVVDLAPSGWAALGTQQCDARLLACG